MSHFLILLVAGVGSSYFVFKSRRVDAFTVAWFSAALYFLPGLVGYTLSPVTPSSPIKLPVELAPEATNIMTAVMLSLLLGGVLYDAFPRPASRSFRRLAPSSRAPDIALILAAIGAVLTYVETGGAAFAADKRVVIEAVGRGHLLWQMAASLAAVFGYAYGRKVVSILAWSLLVLDMYIGFRYAFAMSFLAIALLWASRLGPVTLTKVRARFVVTLLLGGIAIISYQNLKEPIRGGDWSEVGRRMSNPIWYAQGILTSEPFTTQTVLNEIVRRDFRTDGSHVWSSFQHFLLFSPELGAESVRFNDLYQPALFPSVDHGLGNNIWGQMWSAGGWQALSAFILIFVVALTAVSRQLANSDPALSVLTAINAAFLAFYIHRNEILVQLGFHKQLLIVWTACVVASWALSLIVSNLLADREMPVGVPPA